MYDIGKFTKPLLAGAADKPLPEWKDYMDQLSAAGQAAIGSVYKGSNPEDRQDAWILFGEISRGYAVADREAGQKADKAAPALRRGLERNAL